MRGLPSMRPMLVKVFSRGSGGGRAPCKYLLGGDGITPEREGARVLAGDPATTIELIDGNDYARRYTSGVLSFEEQADSLTDEQKREIMHSFEQCIFAGLDADQYDVLWVEHSDKGGRLELNFLIPNVELTSGKRLQPYYHGADKARVNDWKDLTNHEYGLADPNDPLRRRTLVTAKDAPRNKKEAAEAITSGLEALIASGAINDRADVVAALQGAGFDVVRQVKGSISIADPDGGRNIRLKGAIYEQDFRAGRDLQTDVERASREYRDRATERYAATRKRYQERLAAHAERNRGQYPRPIGNSERGIDSDLARTLTAGGNVALDSGIHRHIDRSGDVLPNHDTDAAHHRAAEPRRGAEGIRGNSEPVPERERQSAMRGSHRQGAELDNRNHQQQGDGIHGNSAIRGTHDRDGTAVIERIRAAAERTRAHSERVKSGVREGIDGRLGTIKQRCNGIKEAFHEGSGRYDRVCRNMRETTGAIERHRISSAERFEVMKANMKAAKQAQKAQKRTNRGFDMGR